MIIAQEKCKYIFLVRPAKACLAYLWSLGCSFDGHHDKMSHALIFHLSEDPTHPRDGMQVDNYSL